MRLHVPPAEDPGQRVALAAGVLLVAVVAEGRPRGGPRPDAHQSPDRPGPERQRTSSPAAAGDRGRGQEEEEEGGGQQAPPGAKRRPTPLHFF